jgi:hypothetical protein
MGGAVLEVAGLLDDLEERAAHLEALDAFLERLLDAEHLLKKVHEYI